MNMGALFRGIAQMSSVTFRVGFVGVGGCAVCRVDVASIGWVRGRGWCRGMRVTRTRGHIVTPRWARYVRCLPRRSFRTVETSTRASAPIRGRVADVVYTGVLAGTLWSLVTALIEARDPVAVGVTAGLVTVVVLSVSDLIADVIDVIRRPR
jgi:hypothetical protein